MPRGTGIALSRPAPAGYVRALRNPLYDTDDLLAAATNQVILFQRPQGQTDASANVKTAAETNLTVGGQLANPQMFDLFGFQFEVQGDAAIADKILVYNTGVFRFSFGTQRTWLELPIRRIPDGPQLVTTGAATGTSGTIIRDTIYGWPSVREYYPFVKPSGRPYRIKATETFQVVISWPSGAITPSAVVQIRAYMVGILYVGL
jgi:hypothetical protein